MKKVIVGISGGVDSSVCALLLQKQGYEVEGLFMRNWDSSLNNDIKGNPDLLNHDICPQEEDYNDALKVCEKLGIKLHRIDFVKEYWDDVFTYFLNELKKGRTPNPDVMCNKYIKFDLFKKEAFKLGADYIATGHYAKIEDSYLKKAKDKNKDQSYFLCKLSKEQLENVLFPLADLEKPEVRAIALENDLITAKKKDSTGICFIGERNFKNFLNNYFPNKKGDVIDIATNKKVGTHNGLMYYTIGQRRGLDIGGAENRMFVVGKNLEKNILYITYSEDSNDLRPTEVSCKFRYRQEDIKAEITYLEDDKILIRYNNAKAVCPGQVCAIYKDDICIGGGIISKLYQDDKEMTYVI